MPGQDHASSRRRGRGLWVLLAASLALNLLLVGVIGGAVIRHGGWHDAEVPRLHRRGGPLTRALSGADRRAIRQAMREAYDGRALHGAHRARVEALIADLEAPEFDPAAVAAHLDGYRAAFGERLDTGQRLLLQRLQAMDAAARTAYAARLRQQVQDRSGHRGTGD